MLSDSPDTEVVVVPKGSMMTMDFRPNRLRIIVDADGKVASVPRHG